MTASEKAQITKYYNDHFKAILYFARKGLNAERYVDKQFFKDFIDSFSTADKQA